MYILVLLLLFILLGVTLYFLRATNEAVNKGRPTGGMGEAMVRQKADEDMERAKRKKEEMKDDKSDD